MSSARSASGGQADAAQDVVDLGGEGLAGGGTGRAAQQHDRLADLGAFEEPLGAAQHVRDLRLGQGLLVRLRLGVDPEQHGDLARRNPLVEQLPDGPGHSGGLGGLVVVLGEGRLGPVGPLGDQLQAVRRPALGDHQVGQVDDLRGGAVVADELDDGGVRMLHPEPGQVARAGAGEGVDRLVGVADHAEVVAAAEPGVEQQLLQRVDVLVLVDHEVAVLLPDLRRHLLVLGHHGRGQLQDGLEVDEVALAPDPLVGLVDAAELLGRDRWRAVVLRGGRHVVLRADLRDLGPLHLGGDVAQLRALGGEPQAAARLTQDGQLGLDDRRRRAADHARPEEGELAQRRGVERAGLHPGRAERAQALAQLSRRARGERHSQDALRVDHAAAHRVRDAVGDRPGLARPRAGQHAHRSAHGLGDSALLGVESDQYVVRVVHLCILPAAGGEPLYSGNMRGRRMFVS
jgi:hypothetical protein